MLRSVLTAFGIQEEMLQVTPFGTGLINRTWKVDLPGRTFILQKLNQDVIRDPNLVAQNLRIISNHLTAIHPDYLFVAPLPAMDGGEMYFDGSGYYRLFPFITGSHTIDVVETPEQAGEAAIQFGRFTRLMMGLDPMQLHETIPGFHDLGLRYEQYLHAVRNGNRRRVLDAEDLVKKIGKHSGIVNDYIGIRKNPEFKLRVTHHDTKISNVLFDEKDRGLCVIDMDTVMPGYFFSDVGDMMRTYLSPVSEEETDLAKITVREEFYRAIVRGYLAEMGAGLTAAEKNHIYFSGSFMIYMQAIRFLTDHFNDDAYYGARYPGHNFNRAANQVELLEKYLEMAFLRSE